VIFTFETTHHALWAEEIARDAAIPVDVVPPPPAARARCDIALETLADFEAPLADLLNASGVTFATYRPPG
jgi:hypothetical protein